MADAITITVLTHSPSPYQVELFNTVASSPGVELKVIYLFSGDPSRKWQAIPIRHDALMLDGDVARLGVAISAVAQADIAVFNFYNDPQAARLISERVAGRKPWVFWGERPGFSHPALGRIARRWKLRSLHASRAPIWGIGRFAVERYEEEFGSRRAYHDIPYFSNLSRFANFPRASRAADVRRVILFSGSLIVRKGVDLLARAFLQVAREFPGVCLRIMGDGTEREAMREILEPVASQVEFLGFRDWPDLPAAYAGADVLCVPSRHDGWGLVVPEGLATGLPVIGTDRMGAAIEFVETGKNGWLVRAGDENALHAALREAASVSSAQLSQLSCNARASVAAHSLENGAARFVAASREASVNWVN